SESNDNKGDRRQSQVFSPIPFLPLAGQAKAAQLPSHGDRLTPTARDFWEKRVRNSFKACSGTQGNSSLPEAEREPLTTVSRLSPLINTTPDVAIHFSDRWGSGAWKDFKSF